MKRIFGILVTVFGGIFLLVAFLLIPSLFRFPHLPLVEWLCFLVFLVIGLACFFLGIRLFRAAKPLGAPFFTPINSGGLVTDTNTSMATDGISFTYRFRSEKGGEDGHRALLTIEVNDGLSIHFTARRRGVIDSISLRLGLSAPLVTGDEAFDQKVYVETNHPKTMELYFSKAANRQAVMEILDLGFDHVSCLGQDMIENWTGYKLIDRLNGVPTETGMVANWTNYKPEQRNTLADLEYAAKRLAFLSQSGTGIQNLDVPDREVVTLANPVYLTTKLNVLLIIIIAVLVLVYFVTPLQPPRPLRYFDLFSLYLKSMAYIFPIFLFLTFYYLRGRTTSHRDWISCGGLGFLVLTGFTLSTIHIVNVWADSSPAISFSGQIKSKRIDTNEGRSSYYLLIPSRTDPTDTHEFKTTLQVYESTGPGGLFELVTHAGYLGIEWVESFKVVGR